MSTSKTTDSELEELLRENLELKHKVLQLDLEIEKQVGILLELKKERVKLDTELLKEKPNHEKLNDCEEFLEFVSNIRGDQVCCERERDMITAAERTVTVLKDDYDEEFQLN